MTSRFLTDGLEDDDEVNVHGTDPLLKDTDGDGLPDGWEVDNDLNPLSASGGDGTDGDPDDDGLTNLQEYQRGTKPRKRDTDGDGLSDGDEVNIHGTDPLDTDTDGDGMEDGWEVRYDFNPRVVQTDGTHGAGDDPDGDNLTNLQEFRHGANPFDEDTDDDGLEDGDEVNVHGTSPIRPDTDGDGLTDGEEVITLKANWPCLDPLAWDCDGDGLGLFDEYRYCTSPLNPDTDSDGVRDGDEVPHSPGSCPNDPDGGSSTNCVTLSFTVGDSSGSESERWNLDVFEEDTGRAVYHHCDQGFGAPGSAEYALVKSKAYTFSLKWVATNRDNGPDFDWQAKINGSTAAGALEGLYSTGAVIVEDPDGLLTECTYGGPNNLTIGKEGRIIVPRIKLEPITCGTVGAGVIVNPSGVATGGLAVYRIEIEPEDAVADGDIHWSVAHGGVTFYSGHNTGREAIIRGGAVESDFKLEVRIGDVPETGCPYIHGRVLQPTVTPIHVYIICDSNGVAAVSTDTVDAWIAEANRIYKQAAMSFYVAGVEYVVNTNWFVINSSTEFRQMCSYADVSEGLELYCVRNITFAAGLHSDMNFASSDPRCGIAVGATDAESTTFAHEIGHACGLNDIQYKFTQDTINCDLVGESNWSGGDGTGYYEVDLKHTVLVQRLLMYYKEGPLKDDIAIGTVMGTDKDLPNPYPVGVGLQSMNTRTPSH